MYQVHFYETKDGYKPVYEFLDSLDLKTKAKIMSDIAVLQEI